MDIEDIKIFIKNTQEKSEWYREFENKVWTNVSKYIKENHTE